MKKNLIISILALLTLFLVWEGYILFFSHLKFVLPAPSSIFYRFYSQGDRLLFHTSVTLKEMLAGLLLAFTAAVPLAWLMLWYKPLRMIFQPIIVAIQCIPMFALAPVMILWFGWSFTAIVIPTALMIFFPLTMALYKGLRGTPQALIDFFIVNQATRWQIFLKLQLPWSVPYLLSGLRISCSIAAIAAVAGEWAGAQDGLGVLMLDSRRSFDLEMTFAALFSVMLMSFTLYFSLLLIEKWAKKKCYSFVSSSF